MINFFGAGGGGGVAGVSAGGMFSGAASGGGALLAVICPAFESARLALSATLALCDFLPAAGFAFSAGGALEACMASGLAGAISPVALGGTAGPFPTTRLLTTSFTPGTEAAWRLAASRWASLSTVPLSVTTPFADCTDSCLVERPESWLNLL